MRRILALSVLRCWRAPLSFCLVSNRGIDNPTAAEMSPLEAVFVALSLLNTKFKDHAPLAVWTAYRLAMEPSFSDETSRATAAAHDLLTALGLRR